MPEKSNSIFEKLERERLEITVYLNSLSEIQFNYKPSKEKWSIAQILSHIYMAETQTLAAIKWRLENKKSHGRVGLGAYLRVYFAILTFKLKIKRKAPSFVANVPDFSNKQTFIDDWQKEREEWKQFLADFPKELKNRGVYKHPILGYLNLPLALTFMLSHLQRHKEQIFKNIPEAI